MKCNLIIKSVCGYNLHSVVRAIAIYESVSAPVLSLFICAIIRDGVFYDFSLTERWGLGIIVGVLLPIIRIVISISLFKGCKSRNISLIWLWMIVNFFLYTPGVVSVYFFRDRFHLIHGLPKGKEIDSDVLFVIKISIQMLITVWCLIQYYLAYSFIQEIKSCGNLNLTLCKLSDQAVQELQKDLLNLNGVKVKDFSILMSDLKVDSDIPLGSGSFGTVHKGFLRSGSELTTVAVKSIQNGKDSNYFKTLLEEFAISAYIGSHENVVKMIGTCPELLAQRKLYLVMEYCAFGSMSDFLKSRRSLFVSFVENGLWSGASGYVYANVKSSSTINTLHLVHWIYDICKGMEFLEEKKVIHGDLAARNVLLDYRKVAKISDFGFSKKLYESTNIVREDVKLIPWRWMAIESLTDMEYSSKTDVWSFACTIWEIFSLAEIPFSGHVLDAQFIQNLKSGKLRLQRPLNATHELYALMSWCWSDLPKSRPSFSTMSLQLGEMILKYTSSSLPQLHELREKNTMIK